MRISDWSSDVCSSDLPESWQVRSEQVREHGLQPLLAATAERWFTPAFNATHPDVVRDILQRFAATTTEGYRGCCEALAGADLRPDLHRIQASLLAISGDDDPVCTPAALQHIAEDRKSTRLNSSH